MARRSQYWVMFLVVLFVTAATAALVSADEAAPNIAEQTQVTQEEAAPTFAERIEATKDLSMGQAAQAGETVATWKEWAMKHADEWIGKGKLAAGEASESAKAYATQGAEYSAKAQETASGVYTKWSTWAKETAGKYRPKKNPAAEAIEYVNKHTSGATDEEL